VSDPQLARRVGELDWYHTLDLGDGVVTPGWFDTREVPDRIAFPASFAGMRCLDVGTFDGFWAFEMERRGAAEVVAVDVLDPRQWDWPAGSEESVVEAVGRRKADGVGFEIARQRLGSSVVRHELSVYELDPVALGSFDFVYVGSLLLHLRDPVRAMERVRSVCRGRVLLVDAVDLVLDRLSRAPLARLDGVGRPWWWKPSTAGLVRIVEAAGFRLIGPPRRLFMPPGPGQARPRLRPRMALTRTGWESAVLALRGDPHAAVLAEPRPGLGAG
jgi:tRNA (mo5U34)-methyltransferase